MNFFENWFNSMALFVLTIPIIIIITTAILQYLIKKKLQVISIMFIVQVFLYYGYSCIIQRMKISDVYLDYVVYIALVTLIFGFIGTFVGGVISSFVNGKKHL
ncbi:hypothetical protein FDB72_01865 [Clostridium botulinum]|nr:hypothetical protein [Clostridium botulinum]NFM44908.1 hypothetical protein [Clostridium botulinum]